MTSDIFIAGILILSLVAVIIVMMTSSTTRVSHSRHKFYADRRHGPVGDPSKH